jgi:antitoxin (DNA-binding transcriptional repressor) of toxin-antitoxin stability system
MRFVTVRDLRNTPTTVWSALDKDDLVLTSNGDPVAVLVRVDEDDLDDTLAVVRRARAQQAVSRLRKQAAEAGTADLTEQEIEQEIAAARKERARA